MKATVAVVIGMVIGGGTVWLSYRRPVSAASSLEPAASSPASVSVVAAAQGRVEGLTENIEVGASADGVIRALLVKEGQRVSKGESIGNIACDNLDSEVPALEASRESARQSPVHLFRGSREEERRVAEQDVLAQQAILDQARRQNDRMRYLASKDDVSQQAALNAARDLTTAEASLKADADISAIVESLGATVARRDKCVIRAPINGTITRVNMRVGEAFSTVVPRPIVTMADLSGRRIRAEVDERDLSKIKVNQRVEISAEGYHEHFAGRVTWTFVVMGRRTAKSTDPAERADRDILETLVAPDRGAPPLPIGLRVVVEFLPN